MTEREIAEALDALPGWRRDGDAIVAEWRFPDFARALGFVVSVGALAERADHHPEIVLAHARVRATLTTHDAGAITRRDLDLAAAISAIAPPR